MDEKDKFILSEKDSVPIFDSTEKEIEQSLAKHALLLKKQLEQERRLKAINAGELEGEPFQLIYTGAPQSDTNAAIDQIEQTFMASARIKVGSTKLDQFGNEIPGVTAL